MAKVSLDKSKIKFLLLEGVHQSAVDKLTAAGYTNVEYHKTALPEDELLERVKDAHFIGLRSRTQLTREVFDAAEKLIAVGCFCIGTNQVDLQAAQENGVAVFNAPYSNTRSVAELVIAEAILLSPVNIPELMAAVIVPCLPTVTAPHRHWAPFYRSLAAADTVSSEDGCPRQGGRRRRGQREEVDCGLSMACSLLGPLGRQLRAQLRYMIQLRGPVTV